MRKEREIKRLLQQYNALSGRCYELVRGFNCQSRQHCYAIRERDGGVIVLGELPRATGVMLQLLDSVWA